MTTYDKAALTQDQHLHLLSERGLHIPDESLARHYLSNISYFRLSAYTRAYYRSGGSHQFRPGTCFGDNLNLYTQSLWAVKLQQLMERFPNVSRTHMGFPDEWQKLSFWQQAFGSMEGVE